MHPLKTWLHRLWPQAYTSTPLERLLACLGAGLGLFITEWVSRTTLGSAEPWFIAPMGASAIILFALPQSPLAQPWALIGGNLVAGLVGVTCSQWLGQGGFAIALAPALSLGVMLALRCLHPPSGAVALTAVLGGPAITSLGYGFVITPLLTNSVCLMVLAVAFKRLTKKKTP